jgi:hypothetical protein
MAAAQLPFQFAILKVELERKRGYPPRLFLFPQRLKPVILPI